MTAPDESMHSQEEIRQINAMLKSQLPFIGAAALSRPGWDAEDFIESFAKDWGIELEVLPDERGPGQPFAAALPGTGVVINVWVLNASLTVRQKIISGRKGVH